MQQHKGNNNSIKASLKKRHLEIKIESTTIDRCPFIICHAINCQESIKVVNEITETVMICHQPNHIIVTYDKIQ